MRPVESHYKRGPFAVSPGQIFSYFKGSFTFEELNAKGLWFCLIPHVNQRRDQTL